MKKRSNVKSKKVSAGMAALLRETETRTTNEDENGQADLGFAPNWFDGLNPEQVQVVEHDEGPCVVLALAGSGKTESLSRRIARMVANGINPKRILALTFTKKGGDEMTTRIAKKFNVSGARVGTLHSFCLQILREDKTPFANWAIENDGPGTSTQMVLKDVIGWKGMKWTGADVNALKSFIGKCKANLFTPDSDGAGEMARKTFGFQARLACEAFMHYNEALEQKGLLTFDDYLVRAVDHLKSDENIRLAWAARYDRILQDEAQDANIAQKTLLWLLAKDHGNYMAIGDCFQSIYGFRGSSPEHLAGFAKEWPGAKVVVLPRNYRSGRKIIAAANAIVKHAVVEGIDSPSPMIGERDLDGEVRVLCAESLDDEANEIGNTVQKSVEIGESKFSDHTVLYRTNAQSRAIEEALLQRRIPYVVVGGVSFYERKEVRDLLAYLRLANATAKLDDIKRSINTPFRFLGMKFVERVQDAVDGRDLSTVDWPVVVDKVAAGEGIQRRQRDSAAEWGTIVRTMRTMIEKGARIEASEEDKHDAKPAQLLEYVIRTTKYIDFLNREEGSETTEESGAANVREMVRVAERFATADLLLTYIDETIRSAREQRDDKQAGGERVLLMTVHRAKGLEWPRVYVIGMNEMVLPHAKGDDQEERRLAYVAVTRARDILTMSYVRRIATRAGVRDVAPSRYLVDTGLPLDGPRGSVDVAIVGGMSAESLKAELEVQALESEHS